MVASNSIFVQSYCYSFETNLVGSCMDFITATFKASSFAVTLSIIQQIMAISLIPFYTKLSDVVGRAQALTGALFFCLIGYIIQATSTSFEHLAGVQIVYGLGADGVGN